MFGKFFASTFTGSMVGSGPELFAVWGYVIANTVESQVELNPRHVASLLGMSPEAVAKCIDRLCAPDPESRSKKAKGCRLIREGEFAYFVPNHAAYRAVRDERDRREYNRRKKAEGRSKGVNAYVKKSIRMSSQSAKTEAEAEAEAEARTTKTPPKATAPHGAGRDLQKPKTRTAGPPTWLTPFGIAWQQHCGEHVPWKPLAQQLGPLCKKYDPAHVLGAFRTYLANTEPRYASPARFAATTAQWGISNGGRPKGPHYPTADEADRAAGIPPHP